MDNNSLTAVIAKLEKQIGKERMSAIRRAAAKQGVPVACILGNAVMEYTKTLKDISTDYPK